MSDLKTYTSTYRSEEVANYFIRKSIDEGPPIHSLKLLKLVIFAHSLHLSSFQVPLIDEPIVKGKYGPEITRLRDLIIGNKYTVSPIAGFGFCQSKLLDDIWRIYKDIDYVEMATIINNWFSSINYETPGFFWTNRNIMIAFTEIVNAR